MALTSHQALDVVGFAQFKQKYKQQMEEQAILNPGRITREEFLVEIKRPYIEGLSSDNIKKAFEVTGTWRVDQSKVSVNTVKQSFSLSFKTPATIDPTSPVKSVIATFQEQLEQPSQQPPILEVDLHSPSPISLQASPPPSPTPETDDKYTSNDIRSQLLTTRAAFLVDGSEPSSTHQIPQLVMPPLHPLPLPSESTSSSASHPTVPTVEDLKKRIAALEHDNRTLKQWGVGLHSDITKVRAQLVIQNVENGHLHAGLYWKEQKKKTARERVTPGGRAIEATGDDTMGAMQTIQAEKAIAAQRKGKGKVRPLQEGLGGTLSKEEARKKWEDAIKVWLELRVEL